MAWNRFINWLSDEGEELQVIRSHRLFIQRQGKLLHAICLVFGWALSIGHWDVAPIWAVVVYPGLVTTFSAIRLYSLWKGQNKSLENGDLRRWRRDDGIGVAVTTLMFAGWGLILFPYGGPYLQLQAAFTVVIVNVISICSLSHYRSYAFLCAVLGSGLYIIYFPAVGGPEFVPFAFMAMVGPLSTFFLISSYSKEFSNLLRAREKLKRQTEALEKKQQETQKDSDRYQHIATHDFMTELPNRRYFFSKLDEFGEVARQSGQFFSILVFDLGGFKAINDVAGVAAGDKVLLEIVARTTEHFPKGAFIARMAGDEFAVIAPSDVLDGEQTRQILKTIFKDPCLVGDYSLRLNYSAGMAFLEKVEESGHELLERALYALNTVKEMPNMHLIVFDDAMRAVMQQKVELSGALRSADFDQELSVVFQPIVDITTNTITSVECLARWESPVAGKVSPAEFIPVAESTGLINKLTFVLLEKALDAFKDWPENVKMSFNLSATNLSSRGFVDELLKKIDTARFDPQRLSCEITETSIMWDFNEACRAISTLKNAGISLSLDDFGTGYSSLSHVHSLPLDCIKVDRSFVSGIHPETAGYGIVKSLLALCRDMEISCVVEGVETEEELNVLQDIGTCCVQGYLFSKPLPAEELTVLLNNGLGGEKLPKVVDKTRVS